MGGGGCTEVGGQGRLFKGPDSSRHGQRDPVDGALPAEASGCCQKVGSGHLFGDVE